MTEGKSLWAHPIPGGFHTFPKFSPDGLRILTTVTLPSAKKNEIQVRLAVDGSVLQSSPAKAAAHAVFDSTGEMLIVSETNDSTPQGPSTIRCFSAKDATQSWNIDRPTEASAIALSPDGTELIGGGLNHSLVVWDAKTGEAKGRVDGPIAEPVFMLRFSSDSSR